MKRFLLICVLVAAICLPAMALGETWVGFVERVQEAMEDAEGTVVVSVAEDVASARDTPLTVSADVQLVIEGRGGGFGGMLIGGGDVTLRGEGLSARQIKMDVDSSAKTPFQVKLTIEEGVTIESLVCDGTSQTATELEIYNHGEIKPRLHERPVSLRMEQKKGDVSLTFHNYGSIESSGEDCGMVLGFPAPSGKVYYLNVRNEGSIKIACESDNAASINIWGYMYGNSSGALQYSVTNSGLISVNGAVFVGAYAAKKVYEFSVENLEGGVIENTSKEGPALSVDAANYMKTTEGAIQISNAGTLRAPGTILNLSMETGNTAPFAFSSLGTMERADEGAPVLETTISQWVDNAKKFMDEEKFGVVADAWIEESGFHTLPAGTTMRLVLNAINWKSYNQEAEKYDEEEIISDTVLLSKGEAPAPAPAE